MLSSINYYSRSIATFYHRNNKDLGQTLTRLASGRRFQNPTDDAVNYIRSQSFRMEYRGYENVRQELSEWEGTLQLAGSGADQIVSDLNRMQELIYLSDQDGYSTDELDAMQSEFNQLAQSIQKIVQNTQYEDIDIMNPADDSTAIVTLALKPGGSGASETIAITPGRAVASDVLTNLVTEGTTDISDDGLRAAAQTNVTNALEDVHNYIGKIRGYTSAVRAHINISDSVIENAKGAESVISEIDEVEETVNYTAQDIRKQASLAMMAQANISNRNVLMLYGLGM